MLSRVAAMAVSTGKALLFCGASNVIGFGSLVFSSSDALVSLGTVAVIGILLSMGILIFLLPGWWHGVVDADQAPR